MSEVTPALDFEKSTQANPVQAIDENTGLPVWSLDVLDPDNEARKADRTFTVKLLAKVQPVLPPSLPGLPFTPIVLTDMFVSPWVDSRTCTGPENGRAHRCRARQGWSFRAMGVAAPKNVPGAGSSDSASKVA